MRKPLDGLAIGLVTILCASWGLQQVAMKVAAPSLNPVLQVGIRCAVASVLLVAFMAWRPSVSSGEDSSWRPGLLAGMAFAFEFLLIAWGLMHTTASHMVVFIYTMPIFAALGLHVFVPGERLQGLQWLGVLAAFAGIVLAFISNFLTFDPARMRSILFGDALGVLAGFLWASTTVLIRTTRLAEQSAAVTLLYQLACAAVLLTITGWLVFQDGPVTMTGIAWVSMVYQSLLVAFGSLLVWFWLLRHYLASRISVLTFMTPLFGVIFGVWLLDEPIDAWFLIGAAFVSAGIVLVNLPGRKRVAR